MLRGRQLHHLVLVGGFAVWLANALILWLSEAPLGHDEAQYAIDARDELTGHFSRWGYLSKGMKVISIPGVWLGGSERALRFVPFLISLVFIVVVWRLARRAIGEVGAAWVVAILAGTRSLVKMSGDLLSDIPSTGCMLVAMLVIVGELDRDEHGPRWRLVLIAPLLAAAFYLRYGSVLPIALIVVGALVLGRRAIIVRPWPALVAAVLFVVLLVPHLLQSLEETNKLFGILLESKGVPNETDSYTGQGLVEYLTANPFLYYGIPTVLPMIAGLVALRPRESRGILFVAFVGAGDIIALGLTTHARARYIYLGIVLLVIAGTYVLARFAQARSLRARQSIAAVAALVIATSWVVVTVGMVRQRARQSPRMQAALEARRVVVPDAAGRPCHIITAGQPQLEFYTGCNTFYPDPQQVLAQGHVYYVVRDGMKGWQPDAEGWPGKQTVLVDRPGIVTIERYAP